MNDCIFCKIIAGQIPGAFVYKDDDFVAFLDIRPVNHGHVLPIPRLHAERLVQVPDAILARELPLAARIARAVLEATGMTDFNLFNTNGPLAGQEVAHHHLHIIPRRDGDGLDLTIRPDGYGEGEAARLSQQIAAIIAR